MKKVVIIDDEAPARSLLKEYLADFPSLIVVGEANNGVDAIRVIEEFKPEIAFLDIQMPGMTGFEVIQNLSEVPHIIFTTAYDQYALDAFEVNAVDYLLKPYTKERFGKAIERVKNHASRNLDNIKLLKERLLEQNLQKDEYLDKILVSFRNKLITLKVTDIIWISAEKDYSNLITKDQNFLSNYGISKVAEKLDPKVFIRVHRSSIINFNYIEEIIKYPSSYEVKMKNGDVVRVSRSYLDNIRELTL